MKRMLIIVVCCLIYTLCIGQSKVYWIHGYQSNWTFWDDYSYSIIPYVNRGGCVQWYPNQSISAIASEIDKNEIEPYSTQAILVGHSAGGLVAREIQKNNKKIKAVITAGTPNNGAGIANSVYNFNYYNVLNSVLEKANNTINYTMMAAGNCAPPISSLIAPLCAISTAALPLIENVVISPVLDSLERYIDCQYRNDVTLMDMCSNSSFVGSLNSDSPTVPILSIYGAEDTWPLLRLLATLNGEQSETQYFSYVYQADNIIGQACSIHDAVYDALKWPAIIMPWIWATREILTSSKSKWTEVGNYINYGIHNEYSEMVGAFHTETRTYTSGWWIFKKTYTEMVKVYEDHDGMITERDARLDKTNVQNVKVSGVNHMEMGNNYKMKEILTNALKNGSYGSAFKYSNN